MMENKKCRWQLDIFSNNDTILLLLDDRGDVNE